MSLTVSAALQRAIETFTRIGLPDPETDAQRLLSHSLGVERGALIGMNDRVLSPAELAGFLAAVEQREGRQPVAQIIGRRSFWRHDFHISPAVLDPRPDTETLVEAALAESFDTVLDLGTGSGCILLSLLQERPTARGVGVDISEDALAVAAVNKTELGLAERADLHQSDWFFNVEGRFDLIVSNPPYIAEEVYETLQPEVRQFEPRIALTPGGDGLAPYRIISADAPGYLTLEGCVLVEIGFDQGAAVAQVFRAAGFANVDILPDINGKDRVIRARMR